MPQQEKRRLRILTLNHHEAYLTMLAETAHDFDVLVDYKGLALPWSPTSPATAANLNLCSFDELIAKRLETAYYDYVLCHSLKNLMWFFRYFKQRFIFIEHIPLFFHSPSASFKSRVKRALLKAFMASHRAKLVAVSPFKAQTWQVKGAKTIEPFPLPFPPIKETQRKQSAVFVGNRVKERSFELGWPLLAQVQELVPLTIVGSNPEIKAAMSTSSYAEFQALLQSFPIYLYPIEQPHGDGYNLGLIEAMSMGMAVVTIKNPSSPITHEQNGLVGRNAEELAAQIRHLLANPQEAERLGKAAKESVKQRFSKELFLDKWADAFEL